MIVVRSLAFNVIFYLNLIVWMVVILPVLLLPRYILVAIIRAWANFNFGLLRTIAGIDVEVRGRNKIPPGACLVAAKHQSVWETFALFAFFDDPCFILKRELMWIPFFGWYARKDRLIAVDRGSRSAALRGMKDAAHRELSAHRQIVIFPEGTRRAPGAEPAYKYGVVALYTSLNVPCVPIALNSGLFWPRRQFVRKPGTIVIEILDPIVPGMEKSEFAACLEHTIETASARLIEEAMAPVNLA